MDPTRTSVVRHTSLSFIADTMLSPLRLFVAQKWIPKNNKPHMHFSGQTSSNKPKWLSSLQTVGGACSRRHVLWVARTQRRASSPGRSASTSKAMATCAERPSLVLAGWSLLPTVCKMMAGQGNNRTSSHWPLEVPGFLSGVTKWVGAWCRCNTPWYHDGNYLIIQMQWWWRTIIKTLFLPAEAFKLLKRAFIFSAPAELPAVASWKR